eukprot:sb/3477157/
MSAITETLPRLFYIPGTFPWIEGPKQLARTQHSLLHLSSKIVHRSNSFVAREDEILDITRKNIPRSLWNRAAGCRLKRKVDFMYGYSRILNFNDVPPRCAALSNKWICAC